MPLCTHAFEETVDVPFIELSVTLSEPSIDIVVQSMRNVSRRSNIFGNFRVGCHNSFAGFGLPYTLTRSC